MKRDVSPTWIAAALTMAAALASTEVAAQTKTVGPGVIGQQFVSSGTTTVVGGTTVSTGAADSLVISGAGAVLLDTTGGGISIISTSGDGVLATGTGKITSVGPGPVVFNISSANIDNIIDVQAGTQAILQNVAMSMTGTLGGAIGAFGGSVQITGGTITVVGTTPGQAPAGVFVNAGSSVIFKDVLLSVFGSTIGGFAGIALGGGSFDGSNVTVTTTDQSALLVSGGGSASFVDSSLSSVGAPTIAGTSGAGTIALAGTSVTGDTDWLKVSGGTVGITASASTLTGTATTTAGTSNVALQNGSLWTMTGSSNLTNLINAASTINFTPPVGDPTLQASYKTLTVMNYAGANGTLGLNTFLGNDASPSDRLVVNGGAATGSTVLRITNTTGLGDLTTGSGILVVDAINGAMTDDAFRLAVPVIAGPYEYMLFKGDGNPEAWYLRSTLNCSLPGAPAELCPGIPVTTLPAPISALPCPVPTPVGPPPPAAAVPPGSTPPTTPGAPPPAAQPTTPGVQVPNFRQEVSLYAAIPNLALTYGRKAVGTLHDRVGDDVNWNAPPPPVAITSTAIGDGSPGARPRSTPYVEEAPVPAAFGAWGRVFGEQGDRDGGCPVLVGPSFDYWFTAVQGGFDALRWQHRDGSRDRAGVFGTLGDAHADVDGRTAGGMGPVGDVGRDSFAGYSVGGYWTHYGPSGWYLDGVLLGTWYDVRGQSTRIPALETDGWGLAASIEGGYPVRGLLGGLSGGLLGGISVEPQAQLLYQTVDLGNTRDIAAQVRFDDIESLAGRLGVRFTAAGAVPFGLLPGAVTSWWRPSVWHEFSSDPRTLLSSDIGFLPFRANVGINWVELASGFTYQVGPSTALYASSAYNFDIEGDGEAWDGKVGLKVAW